MIPANHRSMGRSATHSQICTAALWSNCHCPRCHPVSEATGVPPAPAAAAVRSYDPPAADGGTVSKPTPDALCSVVPPGDPAADRGLTPFTPIGGLSDQISAAPYPLPKPLAAARLPDSHDHPSGGPFLPERDA